ncbi:MAG: hypothetical protein D6741_10625 [Planctomycetota bacterium]|nr:MAG: hypothetical protein D6741_10625 [Planctomycetota bacterium]
MFRRASSLPQSCAHDSIDECSFRRRCGCENEAVACRVETVSTNDSGTLKRSHGDDGRKA